MSGDTTEGEVIVDTELFVDAVKKQGEHLKQTMDYMFIEEGMFAFKDINKDGNIDLLWRVPSYRQDNIYLFLNDGSNITMCETYMPSFFRDENTIFPTVDVYCFPDKVLLKTFSTNSTYNVNMEYYNYYKLSNYDLEHIASPYYSWTEENDEITEEQFFLAKGFDKPASKGEYEIYKEFLTADYLKHEQIVLDNQVEKFLTIPNLDEYFDKALKQVIKYY